MNPPRTLVTALSLSAAALVALVAHEGYSDKPIIPIPGDVLTIGFGTTEGVKPTDKTTPVKALERALQDVQ
jgi:lysozyme